jgi:hypothetical protein
MMRVIRTELYFDEKTIRTDKRRSRFRALHFPRENSGLAFVWFRGDAVGPYEDIWASDWFRGKEIGYTKLENAIDLLLQDVAGDEIWSLLDVIDAARNRDIVEYVYDQDVVIEQSPPKAVKFKDLLKSSNTALLIGAYIGQATAGDNPALLLLTVPGGIIVVGSALGVADAMADGLNKHVKRLFGGK